MESSRDVTTIEMYVTIHIQTLAVQRKSRSQTEIPSKVRLIHCYHRKGGHRLDQNLERHTFKARSVRIVFAGLVAVASDATTDLRGHLLLTCLPSAFLLALVLSAG